MAARVLVPRESKLPSEGIMPTVVNRLRIVSWRRERKEFSRRSLLEM